MEIGVVGLGKMGGQIAEKLSQERFKVFGYDQNSELYDDSSFSFETVNDIDALLKKFTEKKNSMGYGSERRTYK